MLQAFLEAFGDILLHLLPWPRTPRGKARVWLGIPLVLITSGVMAFARQGQPLDDFFALGFLAFGGVGAVASASLAWRRPESRPIADCAVVSNLALLALPFLLAVTPDGTAR